MMARAGTRAAAEAAGVGAAYFAAAVFALYFTRFGNGAACLWISGAVLLAKLGVTPMRRWRPVLVACGLAHVAAVAVLGAGPLAAVPLAALGLGEGMLTAVLLRRLRGRDDALDSVGQLAAFVLCAGVVAPALTAAPAAWLISAETGTPFSANLLSWYLGRALGTLTFCPALTLIFSGEARRWVAEASRAQVAEAAALLFLVACVAGAVFARGDASYLFLPVLPVMLATFRVGRLGAASSVVALALVGGCMLGRAGGALGASAVDQVRFLQFYLAVTVLTAFPAAAELRRQRGLFDRLRDSEARYRLLTDHSTDVVLNVGVDGVIGYASPSASQITGGDAAALVGRTALELVHPDDRAAVIRAHFDALGRPDATVAVEYRLAGPPGAGAAPERWFESHTRSVRDASGAAAGVVSALRDITARKALEAELALAAATDPLTGLANRRVFDAALARLLASGRPGCVAIFDLDHFKSVNDRFGHDGGDRVLTAFAAAARRAVREGDVVARLGGEEFGVVLPGASPDQASAVCERLRAALSDAPVPLPTGLARVTASAGLALAGPGATPADVMRAADEALYRAKAGGRDRLNLAA